MSDYPTLPNIVKRHPGKVRASASKTLTELQTETAKNVAADACIDYDALTGTGPDGAVTLADVSAAIKLKMDTLSAQASLSIMLASARKTLAESRSLAEALVDYQQVSAGSADAAMTDQEANDCLWRLGVRSGLTPPKAKIGYTLTNEDGTPHRTKRYTGR